MYKTILLAIDLSKISDVTAIRASELAKTCHANLHASYILNTRDILDQTSYFYNMDIDYETQIIEPAAKEFGEFCVKYHIENDFRHFIKGSPKEEILELAKIISADLIILGGHAHSRLGMLGSVASVIANKATCDVLVVNDPKSAKD